MGVKDPSKFKTNKKIINNMNQAKGYKHFKGVNKDEIANFERPLTKCDYSQVTLEDINLIEDCTKEYLETQKRILFSKTKLEDPFTIAEKYQKILRVINNIDTNSNKLLFVGSNKYYLFDEEYKKELFIIIYTDKNFKYLNYYKLCKKQTNNNLQKVQELMKKNFGFYSFKLILQEIHVSELLKTLENQKNIESKTR